jgi:menaquinone-dependent protoporphyrinogen oxidase
MPTSVLVCYATRYGSTEEVAEAIAKTLHEHGIEVVVRSVLEVQNLDQYGAVVLGAPLYMFHLHKDALHFLARHHAALETRPVFIFALGPLHTDEKEFQGASQQLEKELAKFHWLAPKATKIFGGKFDPQTLKFPYNLFMGKQPASDVRDWAAIRTWASDLASQFHTVVAS